MLKRQCFVSLYVNSIQSATWLKGSITKYFTLFLLSSRPQDRKAWRGRKKNPEVAFSQTHACLVHRHDTENREVPGMEHFPSPDTGITLDKPKHAEQELC